MDKHYGDVCIYAKASSTSIPGEKRSYRDFVLDLSYDDLMKIVKSDQDFDFAIYAGVRNDRRGKYRLICSYDAHLRIIDFLLNNGSYTLTTYPGILAKYTTEGYNTKLMWPELIRMSDRSKGNIMVCLDYKGYDTQLSLDDYRNLSYLVNKHRLVEGSDIHKLYNFFDRWMEQPKQLLSIDQSQKEICIDHYRTLPSGLHGTHSYQNMVAISMLLEAEKLGFVISGFWANGDDQNILIHQRDLDGFIKFVNSNFILNWEKSLVGHNLAVWGKRWFGDNFHPIGEIGTMRSIFEREGGDNNLVEESKFESNVTKLCELGILYIRMGYPKRFILSELETWAQQCKPKLDIYRIPKSLRNLASTISGKRIRHGLPKGLKYSQRYLRDKTLPYTLIGTNDHFTLLHKMWKSNSFYTLEPKNIEYHDRGTILTIKQGIDYSYDGTDIPWMFKKLNVSRAFTPDQDFVRNVLQSTKSYDGPVNKSYNFYDIYSLCEAINERNKYIWSVMKV
jgi:hypothetical protein